jgi:hypothetical protein
MELTDLLAASVGIRNKSNGLSVENEPTRLLTRDARAESGDKEFHDNGWFVLSGDVVSKEDEEKAPQMH